MGCPVCAGSSPKAAGVREDGAVTRGAPAPPPEYYERLGRLTAMAAMAEIQLGLAGWAAKTGEAYTDNWSFARKPGGAARYAEQHLDRLDADLRAELRSALNEFADHINRRHRAAHSVIGLDLRLPQGEQWIIEGPRDEARSMAAHMDDMTEATSELHQLTVRVSQLRNAIARRHHER